MNPKFPGAVPEIPVKDMNKALAYYEHSLGFTIDWGGEEGGIAGISKGDCRMFVTDGAFRAHRGNAAPVLIWINLSSREEVDELYGIWSGAQARVAARPESKPWGLYEFIVEDVDGNFFRVFYDFAGPEREANKL